jgi:hypothetical protein
VPEADDITPLVLQRLGGYWVPESKWIWNIGIFS